jgi:hypothetical protein
MENNAAFKGYTLSEMRRERAINEVKILVAKQELQRVTIGGNSTFHGVAGEIAKIASALKYYEVALAILKLFRRLRRCGKSTTRAVKE